LVLVFSVRRILFVIFGGCLPQLQLVLWVTRLLLRGLVTTWESSLFFGAEQHHVYDVGTICWRSWRTSREVNKATVFSSAITTRFEQYREVSQVCGTDEDAANEVSDLQWCWQLSEAVTAAETAMVEQMSFLKARCDRGRGPMPETDAAVAAQVTPLPAMKDGVSCARFGSVNEIAAESETAFDKPIVMCAAECKREAA
jgi:hypothetical protein